MGRLRRGFESSDIIPRRWLAGKGAGSKGSIPDFGGNKSIRVRSLRTNLGEKQRVLLR
jgi:hypothetical protein